MNTNAMAGTSRVFGPNLDLINQFQGVFFAVFGYFWTEFDIFHENKMARRPENDP